MTRTLLPLLIALLCLPGCLPSWLQGDADTGTPSGLRTFTSEQDFRDCYKLAVLGPESDDGIPSYPYYSRGTVVLANPVADSVGGLANDGAALPSHNCETLTQTDSQYFYVVTDYDISVVRADPANNMEIVGRFSLDGWLNPAALYLVGSRLVMVTSYDYSYDYSWSYTIGDDWLTDGEPYFQVAVIEVEDPTNPHLVREYDIEGTPLASQMVNGKIVMLSANLATAVGYDDGTDFDELATEDILPKCRIVTASGHDTTDSLVTWRNVLAPKDLDGSQITTLTTLDIAGDVTQPSAIALMAFYSVLYVTPQSAYVFNTDYAADGTFRYDCEIHKFSLTGQTPQHAASGNVDARPPYYSTACSEKDGYLRLVLSPIDSAGYDLAILRQNGGTLEVAGQVEDFGADIGFYELGFAGDHAFAYGYDLADPPLHFDLSDPTHPVETGTVDLGRAYGTKRMLDDTHLLIVGCEILVDDPDDRLYGDLGLWMYDLADPTQPALLHHTVIGSGNTGSGAAWYPSELTLADGLMAMPVSLFEGTYPPNVGMLTFSGQYLYRVSIAGGFEGLGRIPTANALYYNSWEQVFFQNDAVYVISDEATKAAAIDAPDTPLSDLRLP